METDKLFKDPDKKLRIIERPDSDFACRGGDFKRVLRATADEERDASSDLDSHLDRARDLMAGTLVQELGYKLEPPFTTTDDGMGRFIYGAKRDMGIVVVVYVSPEPPTWRIHAETTCLPR
ncbi:hypothetical protein GCM10014719_35670 [Planomonospora parontospora subsp. antibiotica]|nr:hypothetical protein GCM10014719_35670 [Planomonospora parontospora subsp. antibiotica]GII16620.1 hypothetical protein Ppa05_33460 [Planomonospora parontospora subsp. antibiotica]